MNGGRPHVALATCAALPQLDDDERLLVTPLEARGAQVSAAVWDDATVDWDSYDLVVVRSTWDYPARREEFVAWARSVPRLANPAEVIEWNTDKRYLAGLESAGLPVVPTTWIAPGDQPVLPTTGEHVVKPAVGAGSLDAERFNLSRPDEQQRAQAHAERLLSTGQTVMVQPYIVSVDTQGESGMVFLRGQLSHAITKSAMLGAPRESVAGLYKSEVIDPRTPTGSELELAQRTLAALPWPASALLYARVDMLEGPDGEPLLIELELTEPSLFMGTAPGSGERFADAIMSALDSKRPGARPSAAGPASLPGERGFLL